jgi:hypothetical protein
MPELAGRTEPVIFREALKINGIETGEDLYPEFAAEQARGAGADTVLPDLTDTSAVLAAIYGQTG